MFGKQNKTDKLDEVVDRILEEMSMYGPETEEYQKLMKQLNKVYKLKADVAKKRVSPDTVVLAVANLLGILIIVAWEERRIISSKAMSLLIKAK